MRKKLLPAVDAKTRRSYQIRTTLFAVLVGCIYITAASFGALYTKLGWSIDVQNSSGSSSLSLQSLGYEALRGLVRRLSSASETDAGATGAIHFTLFGGMTSLDVFVGTMSVIIIVAAVQFVEYLFHSLHVVTHDTPFNQMVQSIEKELMVVGFTAFIFKIIVNTTDFLELEWFHSLEYAG